MNCAKRVLRYVSGTLDYGIFYKRGVPLQLEAFTDANWAGNASDRRSTSGFMFSLRSVAISWSRKKQPTIALSSNEAEYRDTAVAAYAVVWLKRLLKDFNELANKPILMHYNNPAASSSQRIRCFTPELSSSWCTIITSTTV